MKTEELKKRLLNGCREGIAAEAVLTDIDSRFGDADHGLTMAKIAHAMIRGIEEYTGSVKGLMSAAAEAVGAENGGSAVPLWTSWLEGMADACPDSEEIGLDELKAMFAAGFEEFEFMSGAAVGDKTIMDALAPATEAAQAAGDEDVLFTNAAEAAVHGAESTKNFTARYGRAKSYGEKTIGTPDAGALSMSCFFRGMADRN